MKDFQRDTFMRSAAYLNTKRVKHTTCENKTKSAIIEKYRKDGTLVT